MNEVYLGLGGNLGNRELSLELALNEISNQIGVVVSKSSIYETEAWGASNQKNYLNACIKIITKLNASQILHALLHIEIMLGRIRNPDKQYTERTIDIDILFFNKEIINTPELIVPHPRLHLRKFVLKPMCEIDEKFLHPILNKTIFELLTQCDDVLEVKLFKN